MAIGGEHNVYWVFPFDSTTIAESHVDDMWSITYKIIGVDSCPLIFFNKLLMVFKVKDSVTSMKKFFQRDVSLLENLKADDICFDKLKDMLSVFLSKHNKKAKDVTFLEFFDNIFSPQNLGITTSKFPDHTYERQEVWMDGPAVLVNDDIKNKFNEMIKVS